MKKVFCLIVASASVASAGWWTGTDSNAFFVGVSGEDNTSIDASSKVGEVKLYEGAEKNGSTLTIGTLTVGSDVTQISVSKPSTNWARDYNLVINELKVASSVDIFVDTSQSLTLNGVSGGVASIIVNGSLKLNSNVIGLNNFTLDADSSIGGTYNVGTSGVEEVIFTLSDVDVVDAALSNGKNYEKQLTATMWNAEKIGSAVLNVGDYENGGLIFQNVETGAYYSSTTWSADGKVAYSDANIIELADNKAYVVAKINGNRITGLYGVVTIPEPTTATLSLLALAGLAARRRRR